MRERITDYPWISVGILLKNINNFFNTNIKQKDFGKLKLNKGATINFFLFDFFDILDFLYFSDESFFIQIFSIQIFVS
jgi:hypothetical protein